jgi:hypothetical protein
MNTTAIPLQTTTAYALDDNTFISLNALFQSLASVGNLKEGLVIYAAESMSCTASSYFDIENILEEADEEAYDEVGETFNNDFSSCSTEAREELRTLLTAWAEKHVVTDYRRIVGESHAVTITAEMINAFRAEAFHPTGERILGA